MGPQNHQNLRLDGRRQSHQFMVLMLLLTGSTSRSAEVLAWRCLSIEGTLWRRNKSWDLPELPVHLLPSPAESCLPPAAGPVHLLPFTHSSLIISQPGVSSRREWASVLPVFVLAALRLAGTVLVQGAELRAGGREPLLLISTLEAGQDALTEQVLLRLHLQTETQV